MTNTASNWNWFNLPSRTPPPPPLKPLSAAHFVLTSLLSHISLDLIVYVLFDNNNKYTRDSFHQQHERVIKCGTNDLFLCTDDDIDEITYGFPCYSMCCRYAICSGSKSDPYACIFLWVALEFISLRACLVVAHVCVCVCAVFLLVLLMLMLLFCHWFQLNQQSGVERHTEFCPARWEIKVYAGNWISRKS